MKVPTDECINEQLLEAADRTVKLVEKLAVESKPKIANKLSKLLAWLDSQLNK